MDPKLKFFKIISCTLLILLVISGLNLQAQDYYITFSGSGVSSTIDSVKVENLTQGTKLTLKGTDILHLVKGTTGIETISGIVPGKIKFYPNPMKDQARMEFDLPEPGETMISMFDPAGREIEDTRDFLPPGRQTYLIEGVKEGLYIVRIISGRHLYSGKLICSGSQNSSPKIVYEDMENPKVEIESPIKQIDSKSVNEDYVMQFAVNDWFKMTGFFSTVTNDYSTVITTNVADLSNTNSDITFDFRECADGDIWYYPTVQIGSQIWMAANLKTTKYSNGEAIPYVPGEDDWHYIPTPAYCWYNNQPENQDEYGALYNWFTVGTGLLCPVGWHVPTYDEWVILKDHLGSNAGGKLKLTGTTYWLSPNEGATNETGFTALPGGYRSEESAFDKMHEYGFWWSSSAISDYAAICAQLDKFSGSLTMTGTPFKYNGLSVRCLKGELNTVKDLDGNNYTQVKIGEQVWMGENLRTTHFNDGTNISLVTDNNEWSNLTAPAYCWFDNNEAANRKTYGALYNWYAVNTGRLCPLGWRVPDDADWTKLINSFGGVSIAGGKLKEAGTMHWLNPNTGATNESCFSALPGGYRVQLPTGYSGLHERGSFWSSSPYTTVDGSLVILRNDQSSITFGGTNRFHGRSVRCIKGQVGTVEDSDGNVYTTDTIGTQIWMGENLKTTHYNDGASIPYVTSDSDWRNRTLPGYCWYNDDLFTYKNTYGALYNWYTVNTGKLCPTGWHIPTDADWTILTTFLGGAEVAGGKLKEAGTQHWIEPNTYATNETGFTALPAGIRGVDENANYGEMGYSTCWWSSSEHSQSEALTRAIFNNSDDIYDPAHRKSQGYSVRCVKDE